MERRGKGEKGGEGWREKNKTFTRLFCFLASECLYSNKAQKKITPGSSPLISYN
jgi:hypothetical protein